MEFEQAIREIKSDIKELYERTNVHNVCQAQVDIKLEYIKNEIAKIGLKLEDISTKPAKRWDTLVTAVLTGIVTAGISLVISYIMFAGGEK